MEHGNAPQSALSQEAFPLLGQAVTQVGNDGVVGPSVPVGGLHRLHLNLVDRLEFVDGPERNETQAQSATVHLTDDVDQSPDHGENEACNKQVAGEVDPIELLPENRTVT
jgi:hypothetical protein